ncbi:hypothetical protein Tco_0269812 [Tanacetum coccineum]
MVATTCHTDGRLLETFQILHLQWDTVASYAFASSFDAFVSSNHSFMAFHKDLHLQAFMETEKMSNQGWQKAVYNGFLIVSS